MLTILPIPNNVNKEIKLKIAYVLFMDIVGYSKLVTSEQRELVELLNQIVRESEHFRAAEAESCLITVPTGDGMALVFYNTPEAPVECALDVSSAATKHPKLKLRMGIHSGPVTAVVDVSGRSNGSREESPKLDYCSRSCSSCCADYRCRPLVAAFCARRDWH